MLNYENGRKLTILGFGAYALINFGYLVLTLFDFFDSIYALLALSSKVIVVHETYQTFVSIINVCGHLSMIAVAGGFFVMWLDRKKQIDFITCVAVATPSVIYILGILKIFAVGLSSYYTGEGIIGYSTEFGIRLFGAEAHIGGIIGTIVYLLYCAAPSGYFLILAFRAKSFNNVLALLLAGAFVYRTFFNYVFHNIRLAFGIDVIVAVNDISMFITIFFMGLCLFERLKETEV